MCFSHFNKFDVLNFVYRSLKDSELEKIQPKAFEGTELQTLWVSILFHIVLKIVCNSFSESNSLLQSQTHSTMSGYILWVWVDWKQTLDAMILELSGETRKCRISFFWKYKLK